MLRNCKVRVCFDDTMVLYIRLNEIIEIIVKAENSSKVDAMPESSHCCYDKYIEAYIVNYLGYYEELFKESKMEIVIKST